MNDDRLKTLIKLKELAGGVCEAMPFSGEVGDRLCLDPRAVVAESTQPKRPLLEAKELIISHMNKLRELTERAERVGGGARTRGIELSVEVISQLIKRTLMLEERPPLDHRTERVSVSSAVRSTIEL